MSTFFGCLIDGFLNRTSCSLPIIGFIEHFMNSPCDDKICSSRGNNGDSDCSYCRSLADRFVKINPIERESSLNCKGDIIDSVYSGRMFVGK